MPSRPTRFINVVLGLVLVFQTPMQRAVSTAQNGPFQLGTDGISIGQAASDPSLPATCSLPIPTPISPVGGVLVNTLVPFFKWSDAGAVGYYVLVSTTPSISTYFLDGWSHTTGPLYFLVNLAPNSTYYWMVASTCPDASTSPYSTPTAFHTGNITSPFVNPPAMIAPPDGATGLVSNVPFSWGNVSGATGWRLFFYCSLDDAQNNRACSGGSSNQWSNSSLATFGNGTYYWRVGALDNKGWGDLSPIRSFTVSAPTATGFNPYPDGYQLGVTKVG